jgi:hypothetical protein
MVTSTVEIERRLLMHDWTLISLELAWKDGRMTIELRNPKSAQVSLTAVDVSALHVPRAADWGPSVSINAVAGPMILPDGRQRLEIEMQSGDVIAITARSFVMPQESIQT